MGWKLSVASKGWNMLPNVKTQPGFLLYIREHDLLGLFSVILNSLRFYSILT